jgi:hypothetical protein
MRQAFDVIPEKRHAVGVHEFDATALPADATHATVVVRRDGWPGTRTDVDMAFLVMEFSPDGGRSWLKFGGIGMAGGDLFDRHGALTNESWCRCSLPGLGLPGRQIRGRLITNESLRAKVLVVSHTDPLDPFTVGKPPASVGYTDEGFRSGGGASSLTTIQTITLTGTDHMLVVCEANSGYPTGGVHASGVTWDLATPENLTERVWIANSPYMAGSIWTKNYATGGTDTVTASYSGSQDMISLTGVAFSGVNQTTPYRTIDGDNEAAADSNSISVNPSGYDSGDGDMKLIVYFVGDSSTGGPTWGSGITSRVRDRVSNYEWYGVGTKVSSGAMTASLASSLEWVACGLILRGDVAAGLTANAKVANLTVGGVSPAGSGSGAVSQAADVANLDVGAVSPSGSGSGAVSQAANVADLVFAAISPGASPGPVTVSALVADLVVVGVSPAAAGVGVVTISANTANLVLAGIQPTGSAEGSSATAKVANLDVGGVSPSAAGSGVVTISALVADLVVVGVSPAAAGVGVVTISANTANLVLAGIQPGTAVGVLFATAKVANLDVGGVSPGASPGPVTVSALVADLVVVGVSPAAAGVGVVTVSANTANLVLAGIQSFTSDTAVGAALDVDTVVCEYLDVDSTISRIVDLDSSSIV